MGNETENKPQQNPPDFIFVFATLCSLPFLFFVGAVVMEVFNKKSPFSLVASTIFFTPFFLLATVLAAIFIILAWKKSRRNCRPFLSVYVAAMAVYWLMLLSMGTI